MVQRFKTFLFFELAILVTLLFGKEIFANVQVAFLSSLFIILASGYSYKKMVDKGVKSDAYIDDKDPLDKIDDPHGLFEEETNKTDEDLDIKEIIKEERKKVKPLTLSSLREGIKGGLSLYRLGAYLFLFVGFIALKNNHILDIKIYLVALFPGIVCGYLLLRR
ncbi:hypothetical protein MNB_SM-7-188 [hydrothermal vent metagenome]|uniref:Uncharacterized protein n=1 Tax=hydrothermal vent metagenome TaxID=652676 RepID=A0A1W1C029_9ZZZZ